MIKERLNIYALKDDEEKMKFLLKMENDAIIMSISRNKQVTIINKDVSGRSNLAELKSSNIDMLGDSKLNL